MKLFLCCLAAFAAVLAACYLGLAFTAWEFNPGRWTADQRGTVAAIGGIFGLAGAAVVCGVMSDAGRYL